MKTRKEDVVHNYHGTLVADPYRWLENDSDEEVAAWVKAQHEITEEYLENVPRASLKKRLAELWNYPRYSLPTQVGSYYFFQKNDGLQNQPVLYRQKGLKGKPEMILDPNEWSSEGTVALSSFSVDDAGKYMSYTVSAKGSDRQKIHILNLDTKQHLDEVLEWCRFTNMAWVGQKGFYYNRYPKPGTVAKEDENNFNEVYWHTLDTPQAEDTLIYSRPDAKELSFSPSVTVDEKYLILHVFHGTDSRNRFYYGEIDGGKDFVRLLDEGEARYLFLGNEEKKFFFLTNYKAPKGRVIGVDLNKPQKENWEEIIPEQVDVISLACFINGHFIISYMHKAHSLLRKFNREGKFLKDISLPALGSVEEMSGRQNQTEIFIGFTSFLHPSVGLRYDLKEDKLEPFKETTANFKADDFQTTQVFYPSQDGTKISMYLVHKKGLKLNGKNPVLLYGYGGFNIPITPSFAPSRLLWLEKGGVYAVANLRGGSEYGEEWHQAGMLENKQNVFDDFIAAAEWLIEKKYTNPKRLAIEGRSNGGLLVSASMVQRPQLFGAVICGVPVTDMLRYHKFTVGRFWIPEYGNAEENPKHFEFLYKYSPLHNVKEENYPATLVVTADGDDRVVPGHAYKFLATLQEAQKGREPILLRVDLDAGHGHGKPVSKIIDEHADVYGFLFKIFGIG